MKKMILILTLLASAFPYALSSYADINDGLVAYYPFNGNADDESGNGYDGTVFGATLTTDRNGNENSAYYFDGIDDYIEINDPVLTSCPFAVSLWATFDEFPSGLGTNRTIISNIKDNFDYWWGGFYITHMGDDHPDNPFSLQGEHLKITCFLWRDGLYSERWNSQIYGTIKNVSIWHHIVLMGDGYNDVELYVNTNRFRARYHNDNNPGAVSTNNLVIGAHTYEPIQHFFKGKIDDIKIYNRLLYENEIYELYGKRVMKGPLIIE